MPHLILEYTGNLEIDTQATLLQLNEALAGSGHFEENTIKARAVRLTDFLVGTQPAAKRGFVALRLAILTGRTPEVKKQVADLLVASVQKGQRWPEGTQVQITAEVIDMVKEIYGKVVL